MEPHPEVLKVVAEKRSARKGSPVLLDHFLNDRICGEKCVLSQKPLGSWCQGGVHLVVVKMKIFGTAEFRADYMSPGYR